MFEDFEVMLPCTRFELHDCYGSLRVLGVKNLRVSKSGNSIIVVFHTDPVIKEKVVEASKNWVFDLPLLDSPLPELLAFKDCCVRVFEDDEIVYDANTKILKMFQQDFNHSFKMFTKL